MEFSPDLPRLLRAAQSIAVLTGAGVSAESGNPSVPRQLLIDAGELIEPGVPPFCFQSK